uniref:Uncharacterized protein n=1 Tax=Musca domestica TaxID=7370 RepID=A0A1I8N672_MUSDO
MKTTVVFRNGDQIIKENKLISEKNTKYLQAAVEKRFSCVLSLKSSNNFFLWLSVQEKPKKRLNIDICSNTNYKHKAGAGARAENRIYYGNQFRLLHVRILGLAAHIKERFENECNTTTRGQRRLCDDKRENLVCNDTLKRIQNAAATRKDNNSIEALRNLVRRQLKQFPRFEPRSNTKAPSKINVVYSSLEKCKYANDLQKPSDINEDYQQRRRQPQRRRSLGKLESVDGLLTNKYYPHHQQQQQQQHFVANYKEIPFTSDCCVTRTTVRKQRNS